MDTPVQSDVAGDAPDDKSPKVEFSKVELSGDESPGDESPASESPGDDVLADGAVDDRIAISTRGLSMAFEGDWILKDLDVDIRRGQTLAIIGESGCGKTVFMKTLVGLLQPTSGTVKFAQKDLSTLSAQEMTKMRCRWGFVFQNAALFDSMTIYENVAFPLRQNRRISEGETRRLVSTHLQEVGLPPDVVSKKPAELSGGMRKRVGLARALILRPEMVVYDEPTTGLDPIMSDVINELMLDVRRRYPVTSVIVTHDMNTVRKVADRVLMFFPRRRLADPRDSQILFDGSPAELEHAEDRRVRQFVRGEAGERLDEMSKGWDAVTA